MDEHEANVEIDLRRRNDRKKEETLFIGEDKYQVQLRDPIRKSDPEFTIKPAVTTKKVMWLWIWQASECGALIGFLKHFEWGDRLKNLKVKCKPISGVASFKIVIRSFERISIAGYHSIADPTDELAHLLTVYALLLPQATIAKYKMRETGSFTQKFAYQLAFFGESSSEPKEQVNQELLWPGDALLSGLVVLNSKICNSLQTEDSLDTATQENKNQVHSEPQSTSEKKHLFNTSVAKPKKAIETLRLEQGSLVDLVEQAIPEFASPELVFIFMEPSNTDGSEKCEPMTESIQVGTTIYELNGFILNIQHGSYATYIKTQSNIWVVFYDNDVLEVPEIVATWLKENNGLNSCNAVIYSKMIEKRRLGVTLSDSCSPKKMKYTESHEESKGHEMRESVISIESLCSLPSTDSDRPSLMLFISSKMYRHVREISPGLYEDQESSVVFPAHESLIIRNLLQATPGKSLEYRVLFCRVKDSQFQRACCVGTSESAVRVSGAYPQSLHEVWPTGDSLKYEDVFYAPDKLHQSSSNKQGRFAEQCVSLARLYRPELSILRVDVRHSNEEVYYFSDYSVRASLVQSLIRKSKLHEDIFAAFLIMLAPALERNRIIARPPMISSMILASSDEKHLNILADEVKSRRPRCILFPVFVSPTGICEYGAFGNHWVLLCCDIEKRSWILYDSLPMTNPLRLLESKKSNLVALAEKLGVGTPKFEYVKCTRQDNCIDCGIHVCANALGVIFKISVNPFPIHVNDLRKRIYTMLLIVAKLQRDGRGTKFALPTAATNKKILVIQNPWSILEYNKTQEFPNGKVTTHEGTIHDISDIVPHPGYGRVKTDHDTEVTFIRALPSAERALVGVEYVKVEILAADSKGAKMLSKKDHALLWWDWKFAEPESIIILKKDLHAKMLEKFQNPT